MPIKNFASTVIFCKTYNRICCSSQMVHWVELWSWRSLGGYLVRLSLCDVAKEVSLVLNMLKVTASSIRLAYKLIQWKMTRPAPAQCCVSQPSTSTMMCWSKEHDIWRRPMPGFNNNQKVQAVTDDGISNGSFFFLTLLTLLVLESQTSIWFTTKSPTFPEAVLSGHLTETMSVKNTTNKVLHVAPATTYW